MDIKRELEQHFGDYRSAEQNDRWMQAKKQSPIGSFVTGNVVTRQQFGVFLDIGVGFPALLLITQFANLPKPTTINDLPSVGTKIDSIVLLFNDVDHEFVLSQVPYFSHEKP